MAELDVEALQQQLESLKEQQAKAQQKLNEMKAGPKGRLAAGGPGDRGFGPLHRPGGVMARLGPGAGPRGGPPGHQRDGPPGRTSVFDRLYNSRGPSGDLDRDRADRNGLSDGRSSRDDLQLQRHSSRSEPGPDAAQDSARPSIHSRLSSRVVAPDGSAAGGSNDPRNLHEREQHSRESDRQHERDHGREPEAADRAGRKRLLSAVMVNGEARTVSSSVDKDAVEPEPPAKRPTLQTDDRSKRRARNMLGRMLVGTLQKAKDENDAFRSTAARRQELEKRAAEKAAAEAQRLKDQERQARQQERHTQVCQLLDIEQQTKEKELELKHAKIIQRKQKLLGFCVTKTQPPIYWLPSEPSDETAVLLQQHAAAFDEWKQQQMQQLESEKADLAALIASRKEKSALRLSGAPGQHDDEPEEGQFGLEVGADGNAAAAAADEGAAAADEEMAEGAEQQNGDREADEQPQQQQEPEAADIEEAAVEAAADEEAVAVVEHRSSRSRRRHRGSDSDSEEERLLSSDEEDEL